MSLLFRSRDSRQIRLVNRELTAVRAASLVSRSVTGLTALFPRFGSPYPQEKSVPTSWV